MNKLARTHLHRICVPWRTLMIKLFKSISLYPLTSSPASVFSSELPGDSSVEMWSFIFFREKLSGWSLSSLKSSESASHCSSEGPGFDRSIDHWFSRFCLRLFWRFLLSTRSRKSFNFSFLSVKASLFFIPVILVQYSNLSHNKIFVVLLMSQSPRCPA